MFRIECFCDDAKLSKLLWALTELGAYNVTSVPVADTKPNGHDKAPKIPFNEIVDRFFAFAKKHKLKDIRAEHVRQFMVSIGYSAQSYSYFLDKLRTVGAVSKISGKGSFNTKWRVTPSKLKKSQIKTPEPKLEAGA